MVPFLHSVHGAATIAVIAFAAGVAFGVLLTIVILRYFRRASARIRDEQTVQARLNSVTSAQQADRLPSSASPRSGEESSSVEKPAGRPGAAELRQGVAQRHPGDQPASEASPVPAVSAAPAPRVERLAEDVPGSRPQVSLSAPLPERPTRDPITNIVHCYNADQATLLQDYRLQELDVANTEERWKNPEENPRFAVRPGGAYSMLELGREHLVVPRPGLVLTADHHGFGAMGSVFECRNYMKGCRYRTITLVKPARFRREGDLFVLAEPGVLELSGDETDL